MDKYTNLITIMIIILLVLNIGISLFNKETHEYPNTTVIVTTIAPSTTAILERTQTQTFNYTYTRTMTTTKTEIYTNTVTITNTFTLTRTIIRDIYDYEGLEYFPIDKGYYTLYRFIDTANNLNATYKVIIQQIYTKTSLIFLMTFSKINGSGKVLNSALYGKLVDSGDKLLLFFSGCPVREEIQLWLKVFKLPLNIINETTYSYGSIHYKLFKLNKISINGKLFDDVIKIVVDNKNDTMNIIKGSGVFYLAKGIGIIKIEFKRFDGTNFTVTILDWGKEQLHVMKGILTLDGFNSAKGEFAVGLATCSFSYNERNPAFARVSESGEFLLEIFGDTLSIYYGPYTSAGNMFKLNGKYAREMIINYEFLLNKTRIYLSIGLPPSKNTMNKLKNITEWVSLAENLHRQAWLYVVSKAYFDPEYKYAIYESRTLAVKHPEVYLKADAIFNMLLTTAPGMWSYYIVRTDNLDEQEKIYNSIRTEGGENFDWTKFNISMHEPIEYEEMYDRTPAFYPFIDIRLLFMGASLKGINWRAPPISMAEFLYFKYKSEGIKSYIIVASDGKAYIAFKQGSDYVVLNYYGESVKEIPENVVLIFNEDSVWYPLMDRDDRDKDPDLRYLVNKYDKGSSIPNLTADESELVNMLRNCTELDGELDYLWAIYFAGKLHIRSWEYFTEIFAKLYPEDAARIGYELNLYSHGPSIISARNVYVARISNLLSPETATLAAIAKYVESRGGTLDSIMSTWLGFFLNYVATKDNPRQGGLMLWFHSELFFVGIDDAMLTKAGNCIMMQTIMASVLDLANFTKMEVYVAGYKATIESGKKGGHAVLAVYWNGQYGLAENYIWRPYVNAFNLQGPLGYDFLSTDYGWIVLVEHPPYNNGKIRTNLGYETVSAILYHLEELAPRMHIIKYTEPFTGVWELLSDFIKENLRPDNMEIFSF